MQLGELTKPNEVNVNLVQTLREGVAAFAVIWNVVSVLAAVVAVVSVLVGGHILIGVGLLVAVAFTWYLGKMFIGCLAAIAESYFALLAVVESLASDAS